MSSKQDAPHVRVGAMDVYNARKAFIQTGIKKHAAIYTDIGVDVRWSIANQDTAVAHLKMHLPRIEELIKKVSPATSTAKTPSTMTPSTFTSTTLTSTASTSTASTSTTLTSTTSTSIVCFLSTLDLVIRQPLQGDYVIQSIESTLGGQRIDKLNQPSLQLSMNALLSGDHRRVRESSSGGGRRSTIVPLVMAPFFRQNMLLMSQNLAPVELWIIFTRRTHKPIMSSDDGPDCPMTTQTLDCLDIELSLKGEIFLVRDLRIIDRAYASRIKRYSMHIYSNQMIEYTGGLRRGENIIRLDSFVNTVNVLYAWGFDRSKVGRVRILLDGVVYLDSTMDLLEYNKRHSIDAMVVYCALEPLFDKNYSAIHFSSVRDARLILDVVEVDDDDSGERDDHLLCLQSIVYIGAITDQVLVYVDGQVCTRPTSRMLF